MDEIDSASLDKGGMMLYTSGTTSRPVSLVQRDLILLMHEWACSDIEIERSPHPSVSVNGTINVAHRSVEIQHRGPPPPSPSSPPHPRNGEWYPNAPSGWFDCRIHVALHAGKRVEQTCNALLPRAKKRFLYPPENHLPHRRAHNIHPSHGRIHWSANTYAGSSKRSDFSRQSEAQYLRLRSAANADKARMAGFKPRQRPSRTIRYDGDRNGD